MFLNKVQAPMDGRPIRPECRCGGDHLERPGVNCTLNLRKRNPRVLQERGAGVGNLESPTAPLEKNEPNLFLKLRQLLTQRRLRESEPACGSSDVPFLLRRDSGLHESDLDHGPPRSVCTRSGSVDPEGRRFKS